MSFPKGLVLIVLIVLTSALVRADAFDAAGMQATSSPQAPAAPQAQQQPELPKSQVPILGRPTKPDDPVPLLDFGAYFNGKWHFTWDYPESALGAAGGLTGSTVYKAVDEKFFEATTEATNADGSVTIRETIGYLRDRHTLTRTVSDSRGFTYTQIGTVGGDLGGQFTIYLESSPFEFKGHVIRVKSTMRLLSPFNYRVQTTLSEDGGPFLNFGNPWWKKDVPGQSNKQQ